MTKGNINVSKYLGTMEYNKLRYTPVGVGYICSESDHMCPADFPVILYIVGINLQLEDFVIEETTKSLFYWVENDGEVKGRFKYYRYGDSDKFDEFDDVIHKIPGLFI